VIELRMIALVVGYYQVMVTVIVKLKVMIVTLVYGIKRIESCVIELDVAPRHAQWLLLDVLFWLCILLHVTISSTKTKIHPLMAENPMVESSPQDKMIIDDIYKVVVIFCWIDDVDTTS
jgi:hypothetical protein